MQGRIHYIDGLRGFTMILVVFSHIVGAFNSSSLQNINEVLILFRMPLFFFISGYFVYHPDYDLKLFVKRSKRRLLRQLYPTLIIGFIYCYLMEDGNYIRMWFDFYKDGYWFTIVAVEMFFLSAPSLWLMQWANMKKLAIGGGLLIFGCAIYIFNIWSIEFNLIETPIYLFFSLFQLSKYLVFFLSGMVFGMIFKRLQRVIKRPLFAILSGISFFVIHSITGCFRLLSVPLGLLTSFLGVIAIISVFMLIYEKYGFGKTKLAFLSPSIIFQDSLYQYWTISPSSDVISGRLLYSESPDGKNLKEKRECTFGGSHELPRVWHGAVSYDSIYRFAFIESPDKADRIMYAESHDGVNFSAPVAIIEKGIYLNRFYRPFAMACNDSVFCFYGTIDEENQWKIALSPGKDFDNLESESSTCTRKSNLFLKKYKQKIKSLLNRESWRRIFIIALIISFAIGFTRFSWKYPEVLWTISWICSFCLSIGNIQYHPFDTLFILILTGIMSMITSLCSIGLQAIILKKN